MYHCQLEEVADIRTYQWLEKAGLKHSTEALIMSAQEQALNKRSLTSLQTVGSVFPQCDGERNVSHQTHQSQ